MTLPAPNAETASRQRARMWASSYTNSGVPKSAARSSTSQPAIDRRPSGETSVLSGSSRRAIGLTPLHLVGGSDADEPERDDKSDAGRLDQPQPRLGEFGRDV